MEHKTIRGFTAKKFILTGMVTVFLLIALLCYDAASNAPFQGRAIICQSNLFQIGRAITTYRNEHGGKVPPDFHSLIAALRSKTALVCPLTGYVTSPVYLERSYTCRFPTRPNDSDTLCWDSGAHHPWHTVFRFMNHDSRNVLYANGKVVTLSEQQFQHLHLQGQSLIIDRQ